MNSLAKKGCTFILAAFALLLIFVVATYNLDETLASDEKTFQMPGERPMRCQIKVQDARFHDGEMRVIFSADLPAEQKTTTIAFQAVQSIQRQSIKWMAGNRAVIVSVLGSWESGGVRNSSRFFYDFKTGNCFYAQREHDAPEFQKRLNDWQRENSTQ